MSVLLDRMTVMIRPHAATRMAALSACVSQVSWEAEETAAVRGFNPVTLIGLLVQEDRPRNPHVKVASSHCLS